MTESLDPRRLARAREIAAAVVSAPGGTFALPLFQRIETAVEAAEKAEADRARAARLGGGIKVRSGRR